ncbi:MAG TPA: M20/M25/M40 family metallo-hydrolase [Gemmatimonadaceae bacterium]|jgi:acetylornithine deacetylase/succinyl-diaminopimelate desuccinylase-like protein|nr:M20/M25/M40 family metallo-hydrolase [Gemmatimonadaceae bacterium]
MSARDVSFCAPTAGLFARLGAARARLAADDERVLHTQISLSEIPAPTGSEQARGASVAARFRALGLHDIRTDDVGNVLGSRPGTTKESPILVCAHLDTVFPEGTPVGVARDGRQLAGPGIVDNSRGLAAMLAIAEAVDGQRLQTKRPVIFAATVGEEGAGDLRGVKHLFARLDEMPAACIALDGAGDDRIVHRALGARRFRVTFHGAGGHSWAAFGTPNPVHAAGATASKLAALPLPRTPRTTLSVCRIGGGISVNAIPDEAWLEIDLRSSSADVLMRCAADIELAVRAAAREENSRRSPGTLPLAYEISTIGDRPCGEMPATHPLVTAAADATRAIGRSPELATASTDANVPISLGIPAIAIGAGGRGGGVHTAGEWYDNTDGTLGVARALTVVVAAAELAAAV